MIPRRYYNNMLPKDHVQELWTSRSTLFFKVLLVGLDAVRLLSPFTFLPQFLSWDFHFHYYLESSESLDDTTHQHLGTSFHCLDHNPFLYVFCLRRTRHRELSWHVFGESSDLCIFWCTQELCIRMVSRIKKTLDLNKLLIFISQKNLKINIIHFSNK